MMESLDNPLVSKSTSDSSLSVQLHPLVLLTVSDYITRHTLREQEGPILGAIIGQQNGREVTMEHAFECKLKTEPKSKKVAIDEEGRVILDEEWFAQRIEQYKEVHKAPALDLVAMFALSSSNGPQPQHIPILQQLQHHYNDSLILLLFHPDTILDGNMTGSKLPISLYESFYEPGSEGADKSLQVDGWGMGRQLQMRFRELAYEVETGEAEMIAVDFVAKGSGSATAIQTAASSTKPLAPSAKGKVKATESDATGTVTESPLSPEDEELVSSLQGKANAIKMLHQRIQLIKAYLEHLPPSYLNDPSLAAAIDPSQQLNQPLLRNISSLLSRLPLLTPPSSALAATTPGIPTLPSSLATASAHEHSDVHLVSLLSALTRSIAEAKDMGSKYSVVQKARSDKMPSLGQGGPRGMRGGFGAGFGGILDSPGDISTPGEMVPEY